MPIKFRCQHCRQFLGISRSKAEEVVDCPTCGRSIRVPSLDGRVAPMPQPKLDLQDDSLVEALGELAAIGDNSGNLVLATDSAPGDESDELLDESLEDSLAPVPVAEVRVAEPPEPIAAPPLPPPVAEPVVVAPPPAAPATIVEPPPPPAPAPRERRSASGLSGALVVLIGVGSLCAGFVAGWFTAPRGTTTAVPVDGHVTPNERPEPEVGREAITGAISFKTETGDTPDMGACVIALPEERTGDVTLSEVGFRPNDLDDDRGVARAALRAMGGDIAVADDDGEYALELVRPGQYDLLVLSHYQPRDPDDEIPARVDEVLRGFFVRPRAVLGSGRFELQSLRWTGESPAKWSHTFPRADE